MKNVFEICQSKHFPYLFYNLVFVWLSDEFRRVFFEGWKQYLYRPTYKYHISFRITYTWMRNFVRNL